MEDNRMRCLYCGGEIIWDSDANAEDVYADFFGDEEAIVHSLHCSKCGRDYEIVDPTKEERETSYKDYWNC